MLLNAFYCFFRPLLFCLLLLAASIFFASINRELLERFSTEKYYRYRVIFLGPNNHPCGLYHYMKSQPH